MGTMLAFLLTDAAVSAGVPARRAAPRRGCELQPRHGRWRDLDERHRAAVRERGGGQRRAAQPERARRARLRGGARGRGGLARARRGAGRRGGDAAGDGRRARGAQPRRGASARPAGSPTRCSSRPPSSAADANWGRILQTVGAGRVRLALERTQVSLGGVVVFRRGASAGAGGARARRAGAAGPGDRGRGPARRRAGGDARLDLRPVVRLRAHQRRLHDLRARRSGQAALPVC